MPDKKSTLTQKDLDLVKDPDPDNKGGTPAAESGDADDGGSKGADPKEDKTQADATDGDGKRARASSILDDIDDDDAE